MRRDVSYTRLHGADEEAQRTQRNARHQHAFWMLFALVCAFDTLFSFLLFVVIGKDGKGDLGDYFNDVIVHYSFRGSVFDVVMISLARSLLLVVLYWYLNTGKGRIVLVTTFLTSVFLIVKVFYYHFSSGIPSYIMFVTAFILPWVEALLWAVKIVWDERRAIEAAEGTHLKRYDESAPLLPGAGHAATAAHAPSLRLSARRYDMSGHTTPIGTPFGTPPEVSQSFLGDELSHADGAGDALVMGGPSQPLVVPAVRTSLQQRALSPRDLKWIGEAREAIDLIYTLGTSLDGWKLEKDTGNAVVHSRPSPTVKLYRLTTVLEIPPRRAFEMVYNDIERQTQWNKAMTEYRTIEWINDITDITYAVAAESAGGMVSSRDFVNVRQWRLFDDGTYVCGGTGTTHERVPEKPGVTRGLNGPGGFVMSPARDRPGCTQFAWVLNSDIKGWLPRYVIDQAMTGVVLGFNDMLQAHVRDLTRGAH